MKLTNLFRRTTTITEGGTFKVNRKTMHVISVSGQWDEGTGHSAIVVLATKEALPSMPVPIPYNRVDGESACSRCTIPIKPDEGRWAFPSHTLRGPDLLDLTEVPDGDQLVVCKKCGPQLRGTMQLPFKPGVSTLTIAKEDQ
jgi:hypothetical protein